MKLTRILNTPWAAAALAVTALPLAIPSAHAATVWNVNIGTQITTSDNFIGAAPENTVSSTWNSVTTPAPVNQALVDSTGAASAATLTLGGGADQMGTYTYAAFTAITGPEIFETWLKHNGNSLPVAVTFGGLNTGDTYDLIVYSSWVFDNGTAVPISQTVGTGMAGTAYVNNLLSIGTGLVEDTDSANNSSIRGNWIRINGLTPDGSGNLGFDMNGQNAALSGFQLVQQVPEPSAALLGGLGLLALLRRRR